MSKSIRRRGELNNNWRGGRSVASNGYVLLRVGKDHHLADVRGYAYEHRIVAEQLIGRKLEAGEIVHHKNGDKQDNRPENLEVCFGNAEHFLKHRRVGLSRRLPGEANPMISCDCGCGARFEKFDKYGRPRRHVSGHFRYPSKLKEEVLSLLREPISIHRMAQLTGRPTGAIKCLMSKYVRVGIVSRIGRGIYVAKSSDGRKRNEMPEVAV